MSMSVSSLVDLKPVASFIFRNPNEIQPSQKRLEHLGIAVDEDNAAVAPPRLIFRALSPIEDRSGHKKRIRGQTRQVARGSCPKTGTDSRRAIPAGLGAQGLNLPEVLGVVVRLSARARLSSKPQT